MTGALEIVHRYMPKMATSGHHSPFSQQLSKTPLHTYGLAIINDPPIGISAALT
jgi:hypothetical protein